MPSLSLSPSRSCAISLRPSPTLEGLKFTDIEGGFPHSEILGSKLVRSSPRLIAAYHVLHRLIAPRHPPDTLIALDCSHYRCPPTLATSAEGKAAVLLLAEQNRTRHSKTSYCFEHIRGQSGQACPRLVCMILVQAFQIRARKLSSSDPGSSGYVSSSRCLGTRRKRP